MRLRTAIPLLFGAACLGAAALVATAVATMPDPANPATSAPTTTTAVTTPPTTVLIPATINATCTKDVSGKLQHWLASLPAHTTVDATGCYLVNEGIKLQDPQSLEISGGTFKDEAVPTKGAPAVDSPLPVLWFVGGMNVMVTGATIEGAHTGGYDYSAAFQAGIRSDGVRNLDIQHDTITGVGGDGVELNVLRADNDDSGTILNPTVNAWVQYVNITGAGRQGVTMAGVRGAYVGPAVNFKSIGINDFDLEADQGNEGARNVTINGCTADGGASLIANGGLGAAQYTGNVTVENCTMLEKQGGDPILIQATKGSTRGPFTFLNDTLRCGSSVYVGCIQLTGAGVAISDSRVISPGGTVLPTEYKALKSTTLTFSGDTFSGKFKAGVVDKTSTVSP